MTYELVAEVVRSGFIEGRHFGTVVALAADGSVAFSVGDPAASVMPRSSNKPIQAAAMVDSGLDLDDELLALAAASHSGEDFHLDGVRRILASAGLDETALQTPPEWPLDEQARLEYVRSGAKPSRIAMNCSGKHAAMLATCVANDWPLNTYRDPQHPLQQVIAQTFAGLTETPTAHVGVDGCGAPVLSTALLGLATAFRTLALAPSGSAAARVVRAIQLHPEWTSGTRHHEARLIRGIPGLVAKGGAEGVFAAALPDGRSLALKVADGSQRVVPVLAVATMRRLGVAAPVLDEVGRYVLLGGGQQVGEVRAVLAG